MDYICIHFYNNIDFTPFLNEIVLKFPNVKFQKYTLIKQTIN